MKANLSLIGGLLRNSEQRRRNPPLATHVAIAGQAGNVLQQACCLTANVVRSLAINGGVSPPAIFATTPLIDLSLIIPAYNEEKRVEAVLGAFSSFLDEKIEQKKIKSYEILLVANGCSDATVAKAKRFIGKKVRILDFSEKLGKGGAILKGFKAARGDIIGFIDSDLAVLPQDVYRLAELTQYYDAVIGSRYAQGAKIQVKQSLMRGVSSRIFNAFVETLFHLGIKDTQCGAKFFRRGPIGAILPGMKISQYAFDVELLLKIKKKGYTIREEGIMWHDQPYSKFSLWKAPEMFLSLIKLRLRV